MTFQRRIHELLRYAITGAVGVALNVGIVVLLTHYLKIHYLASLVFSSLVVTVVGFFMNRSWTFRMGGTAKFPEFLRYAITTTLQIGAGVAGCALLVDGFGMHYTVAVAAVAILAAPVIYLTHRGWSFGLSWLRDT